MRVTNASVLAMLPATGLAACATNYDQYFKEGSALTGVQAVIAASQFYINKWAIPGTEDICNSVSDCAGNGYLVNQLSWLYQNTTTSAWYGDYEAETEADTFDAAALSTVTSIVPGLEVRFWDTNGDGFTDLIDADYQEGVTIQSITQNANGTYSVYRGNIDTENAATEDGTIFDSALFGGTDPYNESPIAAANFDTTIQVGDVALFHYGMNGWAMKRALPVTGTYITGADHTSYNVDGVIYADALRFSRNNLFISNRPGEFSGAQIYFGLNNNTAIGDVTLWLVPVTNTTNFGAPISLTGDDNSASFLTSAIAQSQAQLDNVTISVDGSDVPSSQMWVNQTVYTTLETAITCANNSLTATASNSFLLDYQKYLLYLNLDGGAKDIGASFAGFDFTGFVNEVQAGSA